MTAIYLISKTCRSLSVQRRTKHLMTFWTVTLDLQSVTICTHFGYSMLGYWAQAMWNTATVRVSRVSRVNRVRIRVSVRIRVRF